MKNLQQDYDNIVSAIAELRSVLLEVHPGVRDESIESPLSVIQHTTKYIRGDKDTFDDWFPNQPSTQRISDADEARNRIINAAAEYEKTGGDAGVANPDYVDPDILDEALQIWAERQNISVDLVPAGDVEKLEELVARYGSELPGGMRMLLDTNRKRNPDFAWKSYSSPYQESFLKDLDTCVRRYVHSRRGRRRDTDTEAVVGGDWGRPADL